MLYLVSLIITAQPKKIMILHSVFQLNDHLFPNKQAQSHQFMLDHATFLLSRAS